MRYPLKQIQCRPWLLNGLSLRLMESHYENNYGGAMRRLNAITAELESLDFARAPGYVVNGLKREQLVALNSTLLHELYFASLGGDGKPTRPLADALAKDFGSVDRWRAEFMAMGHALGGGSGWVVLAYVPRDRQLLNQYAADHTQSVAGGIPILALDMFEHAYHLDFGANARAYVDAFMRNIDWQAVEGRYEDAQKVAPPRPLVQPEFGDLPSVGVEEVKAMLAAFSGGAGDRRAPAALPVTPAGYRRRHPVARPRPPAGLDRRAVEVGARRGVLRVRLSRRLQHGGEAARRRIRCEVHEQRSLGLEGDRRGGAAQHLTPVAVTAGTGRAPRRGARSLRTPGRIARASIAPRRATCATGRRPRARPRRSRAIRRAPAPSR